MPSMLDSDWTSSKPYLSLSRTMARTQYGSTPRRICATRFPASPAIMRHIVAGDDRPVNRRAEHALSPHFRGQSTRNGARSCGGSGSAAGLAAGAGHHGPMADPDLTPDLIRRARAAGIAPSYRDSDREEVTVSA